MTENPNPKRRERLRFRSWHRGTREMDLLLGRFADTHLADLNDAQLDQYETLLTNSDPDLYAWITGAESVPPESDSEVMRLWCRHSFADRQGS